MESRRWYILDRAIDGIEEDAFSHADFAEELKNKIVEIGPPLSIALEGRHGTGKSSIASLLEQKFISDPNFRFIRIEAWRHEGESRRKAFLYDVVSTLEKGCQPHEASQKRKLDELLGRLYTTKAHQVAVFDLVGPSTPFNTLWRNALVGALKLAGIVAAVVFVLGVVLYLALAGTNISTALKALTSTPLEYSAAAGFVTFILQTLKSILEKALEPSRVTYTSGPPASSEQYERIFQEALESVLTADSGKTKQTLVLLIDELDRLPPEEIIEALKAIRTFRDQKLRCVFVVALDEEVVKKALVKSTPGIGVVQTSDQAEEYLNKFFPLRQHIPVLVARDMREYSERLITSSKPRQITAGIAELTEDIRDNVLDALIHQGVKTPRHAIRLLNSFNGDYRIALAREGSVLKRGAITGNLPFLAVITVLREDEPEFYADLVSNHQLIASIDALRSGGSSEEFALNFPGYPELCAKYFAERTLANVSEPDKSKSPDGEAEGKTPEPVSTPSGPDFSTPLPKYRNLILFLSETANFRQNNVAPFIYLREDPTARELGSELHAEMAREFRANLSSLIRQRVGVGGEPYSKAAADVALFCLDESRGNQMDNVLQATCRVFDLLLPSLRTTVASKVAIRLSQAAYIDLIDRIPPEELVAVLAAAPESVSRSRCVQQLVDALNSQDGSQSEENTKLFNALLVHPDLVSEDQRTVLRDFASDSTTTLETATGWLDMLLEHRNDTRIVDGVFGPGFFKSTALLLSKTPVKDITTQDDLLREVADLYKERALRDWPQDFAEAVQAMINAQSWSVVDAGSDVLLENTAQMQPAMVPTAIARLASITTTNVDAERHETFQKIASAAASTLGKTVFAPNDTKAELAAYLDRTLLEGPEEATPGASALLTSLIDNLGVEYFDELAGLLAARVTGDGSTPVPVETARTAFDALLLVADAMTEDDKEALFEDVCAPLRNLSTGEDAAFGADVVIRALSTESLLDEATAQANSLIRFISSANTPEQMGQIGRVLDEAAPHFEEASLTSYLNNLTSLASVLTGTNADFVTSRLKSLDDRGFIPSASRENIAQHIVTRRTQLPATNPASVRMSEMLGAWQGSMEKEVRSKFHTWQCDLIEAGQDIGWKNVVCDWPEVNIPDTIRAIKGGFSVPDLKTPILHDLGSERAQLSPGNAVDVLMGLYEALETTELLAVAQAIGERFTAVEKHKASVSLFESLSTESGSDDVLRELAQLAASWADSFSDAEATYVLPLLSGDSQQRQFALQLLTAQNNAIAIPEEHKVRITEPLAMALANDNTDLIKANLAYARRTGISDQPAYRQALETRKAQSSTLTEALSLDERDIIKTIRGLLSRKRASRPKPQSK